MVLERVADDVDSVAILKSGWSAEKQFIINSAAKLKPPSRRVDLRWEYTLLVIYDTLFCGKLHRLPAVVLSVV